MPTEIHGLPAHVLLVHVVVVLVPIAAILVVLSAAWPTARRKLGWITPLVAFVALASVPVTTHAGEWLRDRVRNSALVDRHAELGDQLLPFMIGVFACAAGIWWLDRRQQQVATDGAAAGWVVPARRALAVVAIAVAALSVIQVYRIGDSGARAAWQGKFSTHSRGGDEANSTGSR